METRSQFNGLWLSGCDVVHVTTFSQTQNFSYLPTACFEIPLRYSTMAEQRMTYWAADAEVDEDLEGVDLNLAIGNFGQTDQYEDGMSDCQNHGSKHV
jgi:hypothetical protein